MHDLDPCALLGLERSLAPGWLMLELEPQDCRNAKACQRG